MLFVTEKALEIVSAIDERFGRGVLKYDRGVLPLR